MCIGGATGAWGDSAFAGAQLLASERCDYIVFEALAEITMGILTRAKAKDPKRGYAVDIIDMIGRDLPGYREQRVAVITNAGGMNPSAAAARLRSQPGGAALKIATVTGDDLTPRLHELRQAGVEVPPDPLSASVYLGARPIAAALGAGADVVITGRCVDSALTLGPLMHEFGWELDAWDRLAQGSLAGHLLECGPQSTGGLLTDWEDIPSWEDLGYPIAECRADGSFVLTKAPGTGGCVDDRTVAEQLLYEIGDPAAYLLPDVTCDFRNVALTQRGADRVEVTGARGRPPPPKLKACAQVADGFKVKVMLMVGGRDAVAKARRLGDDMVARAARVLAHRGQPALSAHDIEILGAESTYGPHARVHDAREVILKLGLHHHDRAALDAVVRELPSFGLAAVGVTGGGTGLARSTPLLRLASFGVSRDAVPVCVTIDDEAIPYAQPMLHTAEPVGSADRSATPEVVHDPVRVPLIAIAHGRSGDKGADANIGLRARHSDFFPLMTARITADVVAAYMAHRIAGPVERYVLDGLTALNFVLRDALGGGGIASLRMDAQGKAYAQQLLDMEIDVPRAWLSHPAFRQTSPRSDT